VQPIVLGLISGSIYALIALGIALVYKSSRVLNFAQAEVGTLTMYAGYGVTVGLGLPWIAGAVTSVVAATVIGLVFERLVVRRMITAPRSTVAVATIGLFSLMLAIEAQFFIAKIYTRMPPPIAHGGVSIAGVYVSASQWLALGVVAVVAAGLTAFLRSTDFGLAVLASADDPVAAQLMGAPRARISALIWGTSGALSALAILLIQPTIGALAPGAFAYLFVGGLTAALVGGLSSLGGARVRCMVVGVIEAEIKAHLVISQIRSSSVAAMLLVVLLVLLLRPQGLLGGKA
jgi:branched-chain amino acid transport system permease protein